MPNDQQRWYAYLDRFVTALGALPEAIPVFRAVAPLVFQYEITDRPEMNYWQRIDAGTISWGPGEYAETTVPTVTHRADFATVKKVHGGELDPIRATMSGRYAVSGDVAKLMTCAPLIPLNPRAHGIAVADGGAP